MMEETERPEDIEIVARKPKRNEHFNALFRNGFASGWEFAVREAFKDALDIKLTQKVIKKKTHRIWTQGQCFSFAAGDVFYNDKLAYEDFNQFLRNKNAVCLQVMSGSPSGFVNQKTYSITQLPVDFIEYQKASAKEAKARSFRVVRQIYDPGEANLRLLTPDDESASLVEKREINLGQDQLVSLLQTGTYFDTDLGMQVDLRYERKDK